MKLSSLHSPKPKATISEGKETELDVTLTLKVRGAQDITDENIGHYLRPMYGADYTVKSIGAPKVTKTAPSYSLKPHRKARDLVRKFVQAAGWTTLNKIQASGGENQISVDINGGIEGLKTNARAYILVDQENNQVIYNSLSGEPTVKLDMNDPQLINIMGAKLRNLSIGGPTKDVLGQFMEED